MAIKEGDFVEVDYTGKLKEDGAVFDTTDESLAKEADIHSENMVYGPVIVCVGKGHILKGLEQKFIGKEPGKFSIDLPPEEAFGKKDASLIQLIPNNKFKENKIQPVPGLQVNIDGALGIIRRVGGGRVLVDFNHPLSGREITYDIDIKRIVTDKKEQITGLLSILMKVKPVDIKIEKDEAVVTLKQELPAKVQEHMSKEFCNMVKLKKIVFKKEEEKKKTDEKEENKTVEKK
ncbi:peptidylprolyl isomerase [Candidatus Woesearchaeota archaeon]|nr:peptidylprolyl isomerase [Candidatus Woesearchaeota archaeon]